MRARDFSRKIHAGRQEERNQGIFRENHHTHKSHVIYIPVFEKPQLDRSIAIKDTIFVYLLTVGRSTLIHPHALPRWHPPASQIIDGECEHATPRINGTSTGPQ
jgi:hypothetical protein